MYNCLTTRFVYNTNLATAYNHGHPCPFCNARSVQKTPANSLLRGTTDIPVRSDTLRIFSSGTDAAGLNRSDISALPKFAIKSVHGCTLLMMRRSRCPAYFQKGAFEKNFRKLLQRDGIDARSVQKTPAGVSLIRRGLFFVKRQRRYAVYLQKV